MDVLAISSWSEITADLRTNWPVYLSMPFVAALIGYVTKVIAVEMMFRPLNFVGVKLGPIPLGWQGILPRNAGRIAAVFTHTLTTELIAAQEIFSRLDSKRVAEEIEGPLVESLERITREVATQYQPGLWETIPEAVRKLVIRRIQNEAPAIIHDLMADVEKNLDQVFDLTDMVVTTLVRDKALINRIFREAGRGEFAFIRRSGIYFGFLIGIIQAVAWALFHNPLIMPVAGLINGFATDLLAIKGMLFLPKEPKKILGYTWQGLFFKRQKEVSADYARLMADEILTPANIIEALLKGPMADKLFVLVQDVVRRTLDEQAGLAKPLVVFAVGSTRYQQMKRTVAEHVMTELPETLKHVETYATEAMDIRNTLAERMQLMTPHAFEQVLRPAFHQDEWTLILVGATVGGAVGFLQDFMVQALSKPVPGITH